jgi:hypothetical protein
MKSALLLWCVEEEDDPLEEMDRNLEGSPDTIGGQKRSHCRVAVWRGCGRVCDVERVNALSRFAVGNAPLVIIEWRKK